MLEQSSVANALAKAIRANGRTVQRFTDPMEAWEFLEQAHEVELLITGVHFPPGKPNGWSLAMMARMKHRGIQCIFLIRPGEDDYVHDLGNCVPLPVDESGLACLVETMLSTAQPATADYSPQDSAGFTAGGV